jgi:hypothetical protein
MELVIMVDASVFKDGSIETVILKFVQETVHFMEVVSMEPVIATWAYYHIYII